MSENAVVSHPQPNHRAPATIKNLASQLPERGKIKIGMRGPKKTSQQGNDFAQPIKLDHFLITTMQRGPDGNFIKDQAIHEALGDKPTEIPVRLLYDDPALSFQTQYACYQGKTLWCRGDGETASRLTPDGKGRFGVPCTCEKADPAYQGRDKCKMNGRLSVLIEGAPGLGGVWKFRTTSYNSVTGIDAAMKFFRHVTGGPLANIPLWLTVRPKQATAPDGMQQTIYVVGLEYRGKNAEELAAIGYQIALHRAQGHIRMEQIEDEARRLLPAPTEDAPLPGDDPEEIVAEFYPEQQGAEALAEVVPPKPTKETIAAEIQQSQAETDKQGDEPDPLEVVNSQGEIILSTAVEKDWAAMLEHIMGLATKAGDEAALKTIIENNSKTLEALADATIRAGIQDSISYFGHEVVLNGSKLQARRVGR